MTTTPKKRGRKSHDFQCTWDDAKTINGLHRKGGENSNVWRIRATGQEFTEPDERLAVARFLKLTGASTQQVITTTQPDSPAGGMTLSRVGVAPTGQESLDDLRVGVTAVLEAAKLAYETGTASLPLNLDCPENWAFFREQLLRRPLYVAQQVGFEQLGYLTDLKRQERAASLAELVELYLKFNKLSDNELSRSKCFWAEFEKVSKRLNVTTVDGVTSDLAHAYESYIEGQKLSPKSKLHRYRKVRGILHFAIKRGKSVEACRKALDTLMMLEVKDAHPLDPTPIAPADFWAIHGEALKAGDTTFGALLLLSLNAALYGGEVAAVKWDEIDFKTGGFVSRRSKTGVSRIAVLWPQTVAAVKAVPHDREDEVFCTKIRSYTVFSVGDKFEKYRDLAGVDKAVTFSWIRDASYSTALEGADFAKAELLAGHRLPGTADAYLRRNPQLVAEACKAIATAFAVAKHVMAK